MKKLAYTLIFLFFAFSIIFCSEQTQKEKQTEIENTETENTKTETMTSATVKGYNSLPDKLEDREVFEYQGEDFSTPADFRENSIKGPQYIDIKDYKLKITGLVDEPIEKTYEEVISLKNYEKAVILNCVEGWSVKILWDGILFRDLMEKVSVKPKANTVIFHAYDGYSTSFPIEYLLDNDIMIAYKMNKKDIPPERGFPFVLVAEKKWGYKWIKWITKIEFSDDEDYRGFWEERGYSNDGSLSKPFFE